MQKIECSFKIERSYDRNKDKWSWWVVDRNGKKVSRKFSNLADALDIERVMNKGVK